MISLDFPGVRHPPHLLLQAQIILMIYWQTDLKRSKLTHGTLDNATMPPENGDGLHRDNISLRVLFLSLLFLMIVPEVSQGAVYKRDGDIIGAVQRYVVKREDNLYEIARRFDIGIVELLAANPGVDPWKPKVGKELAITTMHVLPPIQQGLVLNLSELRLFYFTEDAVITFPIGIGRNGWQTPLGETTIVKKRENPSWIPPASIRQENPDLPDIVPPGPDNPLGAFALNLGWAGYAIHGTNRPYGVGKRSSHGCIRLYPEDIKALFNEVSVGETVTVIDTSYKLGWNNGTLFLEVTPTQEQADTIAQYKRPSALGMSEKIQDAVRQMVDDDASINWYAVDEAVAKRSGIPAPITF